MPITRARSILSIVLILFILGVAVVAGAANSLQEKTKAANHQDQADEALLSNVRQYCASTLGSGYSLQVQKTYNGGYLFICAQKNVDENRGEVPAAYSEGLPSHCGILRNSGEKRGI